MRGVPRVVLLDGAVEQVPERLLVGLGHPQVERAGVEVGRLQSVLDAAQVALPGTFVVLVVWLGARLAVAGSITVGGAISGYSATGRARWAMPPTIRMMIDRTVAKIGRSMKIRDNGRP